MLSVVHRNPNTWSPHVSSQKITVHKPNCCTVIVRLIEKIWPSFDLSKSLKVKENGVRNLIHV